MEAGIQFRNITNIEDVKRAGFAHMEVPYEKIEDYMKTNPMPVAGITKEAAGLGQIEFQRVLAKAVSNRANYVVLDTEKLSSSKELKQVLMNSLEHIKKASMPIHIENGYAYSGLADAVTLKEFVDDLNQAAGLDCFGVCLNIGHANVLGKNICAMIQELGNRIKLLHVNDNDGMRDLHQMPHTFTTGRGALSTDWYRIVAGLVRAGYRGTLVFDTHGLFSQTPQQLHGAMLDLLAALAVEWDRQLEFGQLLKKNKQIILFGAGNMFCNYMKAWGEEYPPVFIVDNNRNIRGEKRLGIEVKSPEAILEIPKEHRTVLICNIYYREIEAQLEQMGVDAGRYEERYYL